MKQVLQNFKSGELKIADIPVPALKSGGVLVRNVSSFISAGTESMLIDLAVELWLAFHPNVTLAIYRILLSFTNANYE